MLTKADAERMREIASILYQIALQYPTENHPKAVMDLHRMADAVAPEEN